MKFINKDTEIFGSFSSKAGNNGCITFNDCFRYYGMNSIYKSFSVDNIELAVLSARTLNFKGFAVSMPFKRDVIKFIDEVDVDANNIGSVNTVINENGYLVGYNTDYLAVMEIIEEKEIDNITILGNGGFAKSVVYACVKLGVKYTQITRKDWGIIPLIKNTTVINCTPVDNIKFDNTVYFIDGIPTTDTGKYISKKQARYQFELYTKNKFPL